MDLINNENELSQQIKTNVKNIVIRDKAKFIQRKSFKAGLIFPVGRIARYLKEGQYSKKITDKCVIYFTAILEFIISQVINSSVKVTKKNNKRVIKPKYIQIAISNDVDLSVLLNNIMITFFEV